MRSISSALETAQKDYSVTPTVHLVIGGTNYSSRILVLEHIEEAYAEQATIVIRNDDRDLDNDNLLGEYFEVGYGAGGDYVNTPGLWVKSQQFVSFEGKLACVLWCEGYWALLRELRVMIVGDPPTYDAVYDRTHTVYELIKLVLESAGFTLEALGTQDDGIINTFKPWFDINEMPYETYASVLYRLICMTKCYLRPKAGKTFQVVYPQASDAKNETYYSYRRHYFHEYMEKTNLLVPNSVAVFCNQSEDGSWANLITGTASDADAVEAYGMEVLQPEMAATINNQSDATNRAAAILTRLEGETLAGRLIVPHDCRVELYDKVEVRDTR